MALGDRSQTASAVLMVRPSHFGSNPETAASNRFQQTVSDPPEAIADSARREFDDCVNALTDAGVTTVVVEEPVESGLPDAVFPNNGFSTHGDGTLILYPMASALRRRERRIIPAVVAALEAEDFVVHRQLDLTGLEVRGEYLEGTGSLVLDRANGTAYAALSERTHPAALREFAVRTGYRVTAFGAQDVAGHAIYHTNVMMAVGSTLAVLCLEAIRSPVERELLKSAMLESGRSLLDISLGQVSQFAGNVLELRTPEGDALTVVSRRAWGNLSTAQRRQIESRSRPIVVAVDTIETVGGGSVRCMLAEIVLPKRSVTEGSI